MNFTQLTYGRQQNFSFEFAEVHTSLQQSQLDLHSCRDYFFLSMKSAMINLPCSWMALKPIKLLKFRIKANQKESILRCRQLYFLSNVARCLDFSTLLVR